jgi:hypothetical protein
VKYSSGRRWTDLGDVLQEQYAATRKIDPLSLKRA